MKTIKLLLLFVFVFTTHSNTSARYLSSEERSNIASKCLVNSGIDKNIVMNAVKTAEVPEDTKYKKFLHCSYMGQGYQKQNGEIIYSEIKEFLSTLKEYTKYDVDFIVDNCVGMKGETPGEIAVETLKCLIKNMKEIDKNNEVDS